NRDPHRQGSCSRPPDRQLLDTVYEDILLKLDLLKRPSKLKRRNTAQQRIESYIQLETGERLPQALVHAVAKCNVMTGIAVDIKSVGVGKDGAIPISRGVERDDCLTRPNELAANLYIALGDAATPTMTHVQVTQQFLNSARDQRLVSLEIPHLIGIGQQRQG